MGLSTNSGGNKGATSTNRGPINHGGSIRGGQTSKKSSSIWDTDFDGAWEMGRDLIREFVMKQNSRNRSISESDACKFVELQTSRHNPIDDDIYDDEVDSCGGIGAVMNKRLNKDDGIMVGAAATAAIADAGGLTGNNATRFCNAMDEDDNLMQVAAAATSSIFNQNITLNTNQKQQRPTQMSSININVTDSGSFSSAINVADTSILMLGNLIRPQGYATPDTLSSLNDTTASSASVPRRLYEREVSNESLNAINTNSVIASEDDRNDTSGDESNHLAAFKAKFNRNVEALWDDEKNDDERETAVKQFASQPATNNVQSFWFNYYKHHYNNDEQNNAQAAFSSMYPMQSDKNQYKDLNDLSSLPHINACKMTADRHCNLSAQFEMPPNQNGNGTNIGGGGGGTGAGGVVVGGIGGVITAATAGAAGGGGMNLTSSIWSDTVANNESDLSFYANAAALWEKNGNGNGSKAEPGLKVNIVFPFCAYSFGLYAKLSNLLTIFNS